MNKVHPDITKLQIVLQSYADKVSVDIDNETISERKCSLLFDLIVSEYVQGAVSVDDLSALCEMVYGKLEVGSELYSLLLMGAEIEWYIRHQPRLAADAIEDLLRRFSRHALKQ